MLLHCVQQPADRLMFCHVPVNFVPVQVEEQAKGGKGKAKK